MLTASKGSLGGYLTLLEVVIVFLMFVAWAIKHFKCLFTWELNPWYTANLPCVACFLLQKGHISSTPYRGILDRLAMEDIIFSHYGGHRQVQPFKRYYSTLIGLWQTKGKKYRHLPEQVKREYDHGHSQTSVICASRWFCPKSIGLPCLRNSHHTTCSTGSDGSGSVVLWVHDMVL